MLFPTFQNALHTWYRAVERDVFIPYAEKHPRGEGDPARSIAQFEFMSRPFDPSFPMWQAVARAANEDPRLRTHFGALVGSDFGGTVLQLEDLGKELTAASLHNILDDGGTGHIGDDEFAMLYNEAAAFVESEDIPFQAVALIIGLQSEVMPIEFGDGVSIVLAPENDAVVSSLSMVLLDVAFRQMQTAGGLGNDVKVPAFYRHAFRQEFTTAKRFDVGHDPAVLEKHLRIIDENLKNCLRALATAIPMRIMPWPLQIREIGWRARRSGYMTLPAPHTIARIATPVSVITPDLLPTIQRAWSHVRHPGFPKANAAVRVALDRLAGLGTRQPEDQLTTL